MLNLEEKKLLFDKNGFIVIEEILAVESSFRYFEQVKAEVNQEYDLNYKEIKHLGGFLTGNLDLKPSNLILKIWNILEERNLPNIIKKLTGKELKNFQVKYAGNISLPNKGNQFYHTDGPKKARKILIGVPIENLEELDGPTELLPGSHNQRVSYWKFHLQKFFKEKKKLVLKKGDIFIRESYIWHKGTKNKSNKLRTIILFILSEKKDNSLKSQDILEKIKFGENMFSTNYKGRIKEVVSVYLPLLYFFYKLIISIIKK